MNRSHLAAWVLTSSILSAWLCASPIAAQVVPDNTLPAGERSQVSGNPVVQIDGGARRGGNLFHSFSQFSVLTGGSAYFNNAADVQNIFSRVTGGSISNIDGVLRANGTANLFLLNPNGILFGPNASLNLGGSFVATTADAIGFPNGEVFSSDATQPLPSQLLSVNPNALFFNQLAAQAIVNRSTANGTGLQVPARQNLMLVGGAVQLENGRLTSPGSYVELGGVGGVGTVGLSTAGEDWRLDIPEGVPRADVFLRHGGQINLRNPASARAVNGVIVTGDSGSIRILGRNIDLLGSSLWLEIPSSSTSPNAQTSGIELNATGSISLNQSVVANRLFSQGTTGGITLTAGDRIAFANKSLVYNTIDYGGSGRTGDINVSTGSLFMTDGSQLISGTRGPANTGSININARDTVSLDGIRDGARTSMFNIVDPAGTGNAGNITITTGSLSLTAGAGINSSTFGQGDAGSVIIHARNAVSLDSDSLVFTAVEETSTGKAGNITLTTGSLALTRGSQLISNTRGQGNAGSVTIDAHDAVSFDGTDENGYASGVFTSVEKTGIGKAGNITLTTGSLSLAGGAKLVSSTFGQGDAGGVTIYTRDAVSLDDSNVFTRVEGTGIGKAGDITLTTGSLSLTGGSQLVSSTFGQGNAGSVTINARNAVSLDNINENGYTSGVFTAVGSTGIGKAGNITLTAGSLALTRGSQLVSATFGQGDAGSVTINARNAISLDGVDSNGNASGVFTTVEETGIGKAGNITLTSRSLSLTGGAALAAYTAGTGNAGNITTSADTVALSSGGQLLTTTFSSGNAGNITVNTPNLQLSGATSGLFAQTTSTGNAGNLTIQPRDNGQSVRVNLQDGAQISASTSSSGRGGDLTIAAPDSITLTGNGSVIAAGTGSSGNGGNLFLRTRNLNIQNQAEVTVSSSGTGSAGNLFVDADRIFLNNRGSIRADTTGGGGNINLRSPFILLRNGSNITTNARGSNIPGGNITIDTRFLIAVLNEDSNISANSEDFRGGNVRINAFSIFGIQPSLVSTPLSDITATGATSALPGTIDVITSGLDPTSGLVALPTDLADSSGLIAQGCPANQGNAFVITGRGGLPPNPEQQLDDDAEWSDRRRLIVAQTMEQGSRGRGDAETQRRRDVSDSKSPSTSIIEATGVQVTSMGEIVLVASTPDPTIQNRLHQAVACQGR